MRFNPFIVPGLLLLAGFSMPASVIRTSFGPEISAEDFRQHVRHLQALPREPATESDSLKQRYLQAQFARLGIAHQVLSCAPALGVQATLAGTEGGQAPMLYFANWQNPHDVAGVLEVAERFMTQRPRPKHDVLFVFAEVQSLQDTHCNTWNRAYRQTAPENLNTLSAPALVQTLNQWHIAGK
jgi:hypothetical protein